MPSWVDRGLASAGFAGCVLAIVVLALALRAGRAEQPWAEGNEGMLSILAALVLASFLVGVAIF